MSEGMTECVVGARERGRGRGREKRRARLFEEDGPVPSRLDRPASAPEERVSPTPRRERKRDRERDARVARKVVAARLVLVVVQAPVLEHEPAHTRCR